MSSPRPQSTTPDPSADKLLDADPDIDMINVPTTSAPLADSNDPDFDILKTENDDADLGLDGIDEHRRTTNGVNGISGATNGLGGDGGPRPREKPLRRSHSSRGGRGPSPREEGHQSAGVPREDGRVRSNRPSPHLSPPSLPTLH